MSGTPDPDRSEDPAPGAGNPVLGRYAHRVADADEVRTVWLLAMPTALFLRAREHHDDLIREFALMAIRQADGTGGATTPPQLADLVEILGHEYGGSASRDHPERDAAIERGDATVDVRYDMPVSMRADLVRLSELMDAADEFCRQEKLLTLPRDATVAAFGRWYTGEFLRQLDGLPPTPWTGPLE